MRVFRPGSEPRDGPSRRLYRLLVDEDERLGEDLPGSLADEVPGNAARLVGALSLQKVGDVAVDPRTVLAWLLSGLGAASWMLGLLVPLRESGALLPQVALGAWARQQRHRRWIWVAGALGQAGAVAVMVGFAALARGDVAGLGILAALALFALSRALSSLAYSDVLGRTVPRGARGRITGAATLVSGVVAVAAGAALRLMGGEEESIRTLALVLAAGSGAWVAAAALFAGVREAPADCYPNPDRPFPGFTLLRDDVPFRRFVLARTLLLVSALSPPFVVGLAAREGGVGLQGLGPFIVSGGVSALVGGALWGRLADRSSRGTMMAAAGAASGVLLLFLAALRVEGAAGFALLYPAVHLLLALAHTGARIGRKTYLVDLAAGTDRTDRVAVANTTMGVLLLVTGGISAVLSGLGAEAALLFLALLGVAGVLVSRSLPETP